MKRRSLPISLAFLLALPLASLLVTAPSSAENPECLGSRCGRPQESSPVASGGFLETTWDEILAVFRF